MSNKEHIRFIINPKSGRKRPKKWSKLIPKTLDLNQFSYDIVYTEKKGHGIELTKKAVEEKIPIICAIGGDGSVHDIGTTLVGTDTKLAIIPRGSGNGLARHMKISRKPRKALKCLNKNNFTRIDTVQINDRKFIGVAGVGLDALIAEKFEHLDKRGLKGYVKVVRQEYFKYKPIKVQIEINGEVSNEEVFLCSIANGTEFGNGFCISPESKIDDGELELMRLRKIKDVDIPFIALRFFNKTIHKSKFSTITKFKKAKIQLETEVIHLDGESVKIASPLTIEVIPKSLTILTNKKKK